MFKTYKGRPPYYFRYIHILLLYCTAHQSIVGAHVPSYYYQCAYDYDEPTNYEEYGEFAEILKVFEDEIALQEEVDESEAIEKGVFSKWTKKLKRWFLKRTKKVLKKCLKLTHCSNPEECAYTAAKFKRKIDKVCNTGSIDNIFSNFDKNIPKGKNIDSFEYFKDRIRFYHKNKHAKPSKYVAKGEVRDDLKNIPFGAVMGGLEIFCGSLVAVLPFPGCRYLGADGLSRIITAYADDYEHNHPNDSKKQEFNKTNSLPHNVLENLFPISNSTVP